MKSSFCCCFGFLLTLWKVRVGKERPCRKPGRAREAQAGPAGEHPCSQVHMPELLPALIPSRERGAGRGERGAGSGEGGTGSGERGAESSRAPVPPSLAPALGLRDEPCPAALEPGASSPGRRRLSEVRCLLIAEDKKSLGPLFFVPKYRTSCFQASHRWRNFNLCFLSLGEKHLLLCPCR